MRFAGYFTAAAAFAAPSLQAPQTPHDHGAEHPAQLERLHSQRLESFRGILANIGHSPSSRWEQNAPGAMKGLVVASPTKENPDYFYTWTRDSSLTFKALIDDFATNYTLPELSNMNRLIQTYIVSQGQLQNLTNPSGPLCGGGLGETRFFINGSVVNDDWPRPQRDGPALRVSALISYANYLFDKYLTASAIEWDRYHAYIEYIIWPIVQNDLTYVSEHWNETTYDLWESIKSSSMFATAVQYRALVEGNELAKRLKKTCPNCESQAPQILCFLQSYWTGSYMLANTGGGRSGIDVQTLLASVHIYDPNASCDGTYFQPCSDRALANHKVVVDSFRQIYPINKNKTKGAIAVGRYPEDEYFGGNPWYLSNFGAAEQLYYAVRQWINQGHIDITPTSLAFFQDLPLKFEVAVGTYRGSVMEESQFNYILAAVWTYADELLLNPPNLCVHCEVPSQEAYSMNEQFNKVNGKPLSAKELTWSNAAFLTAINARDNLRHYVAAGPASWGADKVQLPTKCEKSSATGACAPPFKMRAESTDV